MALTSGEFDLLCAFVEHRRPRAVARLPARADARARGRPFDRTIDVQVGRLRKKLEADADDPQHHQVGARRRLHPGAAGDRGADAPDTSRRTPAVRVPAGLDERSVFRSLFAAYPDALIVVDATGRIVLANPSAAALLGYERRRAGRPGGRRARARQRSGRATRRIATPTGAARGARPMGTQMELVARRRDGSEVMVEIALSPLQDHGLPLVVAAIRDIGAYPRVQAGAAARALQRAPGAARPPGGRRARSAGAARRTCRRSPREALQVEVAVVFLLEAEPARFRASPAASALVAGEAVATAWPTAPTPRPASCSPAGPVR